MRRAGQDDKKVAPFREGRIDCLDYLFPAEKILDKLSLEYHTSDKSRILKIRLSGKDLKRERFLSKIVWMSQSLSLMVKYTLAERLTK